MHQNHSEKYTLSISIHSTSFACFFWPSTLGLKQTAGSEPSHHGSKAAGWQTELLLWIYDSQGCVALSLLEPLQERFCRHDQF